MSMKETFAVIQEGNKHRVVAGQARASDRA